VASITGHIICCPIFSPETCFFSSINNRAVCTSCTSPFSLLKHVFSAALIMGWCAHHMLPSFFSRNTFFLRKNGSRLNISIFYDCISIVLILLLFIIIL
jgi:hypothetical protein